MVSYTYSKLQRSTYLRDLLIYSDIYNYLLIYSNIYNSLKITQTKLNAKNNQYASKPKVSPHYPFNRKLIDSQHY
jgi:hypothetical protein